MIYETDLFSFSFVPNWYLQLDALAELALPEPWRFRSGSYSEKNYDTPILERYIQSIFRKQVIDYNAATDKAEQDQIILLRNEYACFHTGLYTKRYKPIYACFGRNKKLDSLIKVVLPGLRGRKLCAAALYLPIAGKASLLNADARYSLHSRLAGARQRGAYPRRPGQCRKIAHRTAKRPQSASPSGNGG